MYATNGLADIIGIPANELCGKSFYYCIQENCLREAVKCLESAKANDSIAYLRFWYRDPRQDQQADHDEHMSDGHSSGDDDDGGVHLAELMDHEGSENAVYSDSSNSMRSSVERDRMHNDSFDPNSRSSSGNSTDMGANSNEAMFDQPARAQQSRTSSISTPDDQQSSWSSSSAQIELEAVVSCTSDGLVVVLRRAKPFVPQISHPTHEAVQSPYANGYFASPWASDPILPSAGDRTHPALPHLQQPSQAPLHPTATVGNAAAAKGPATEDFMNSIREVAVFAWALTGINGSLEKYQRGTPSGESQPPGGLPVWDPSANAGPENIERPIGGAFISDTYASNVQNQGRGQNDSGGAYGEDSREHDQEYVHQGHPYSDTSHRQNQSFGSPNHTQSIGAQFNGGSNGIQHDDQDALPQRKENDYNPHSIGYHNSAVPNGSWAYQPQQEHAWSPVRQPEQSNFMNRNTSNGGRFE